MRVGRSIVVGSEYNAPAATFCQTTGHSSKTTRRRSPDSGLDLKCLSYANWTLAERKDRLGHASVIYRRFSDTGLQIVPSGLRSLARRTFSAGLALSVFGKRSAEITFSTKQYGTSSQDSVETTGRGIVHARRIFRWHTTYSILIHMIGRY